MKQLMRERYVTGIITNRFEEAMDMRDLVAKEAKTPVWVQRKTKFHSRN